MRLAGFAGGSYTLAALAAEAQECINLYPQRIESGTGPNALALCGTPGTAVFATLPAAPVRGLWANDPSGIAGAGRLFAVGGSKLYEVSAAGAPAELGDVGNDAGNTPVQIYPNGAQLYVVSAGKAYVDNGDGPVAVEFTDDGGDVAAATGAFLDSYFVAAPGDKKFYISALLDGTIWEPLEHGVKEGYPDNIIAVHADHSELWLMGDQSIEVWRNEGDADFPFRRDPGGFMHYGLAARFSPASVAGGVAWLAGDTRGRLGAVWARGFQPQRISTHAVEEAWEAYSTVKDAISYAYTQNGHPFWVITFPAANATWAYDFAAGAWHRRAHGAGLNRHRGRCHAYVFDKHLVGDHTTGAIYRMSPDLFDDAGTAITRVRRAPHIVDELRNVSYHAFRLNGHAVGGSAMQLRWSDDGGQTFTAARGPDGAAGNEAEWRRLGAGRDRVFEVRSSAAVRHCWVDAYLRVTAGVA